MNAEPPCSPRWLSQWLIAAGIGLTFTPPVAAQALAAEQGAAVFRDQVRLVLVETCLTCHGPDQKKGGLDLSRRASTLAGGDGGEAIVPGRPDDSLLWEKLVDGQMPPKHPLQPAQVAAFREWIEAGAPFEGEPLAARRAGPGWWSLQPIRRPEIPAVRDGGWVRNPIDAFIRKRLESDGLAPAPEADRATLLRRATFDLTGLPPSPEQVDEFVRDPAPDAYETRVDRLLASPRYGERWGRHWLDVVRFGESHGYETNALRPTAWPYRDYVIRAFNDDTPLPRFVREQLAGDTLADGDWLTRSATGFLVGGTHDVVGNQTLEGQLQQRADDLDDLITATSTAFLGLTVACARCHDHKFDPIPQRDYYGLQAVFAGVQHAERDVARPDAEDRRRQAAAAREELARLDRRLDDLEPLTDPDASGPSRPAVSPRRNVERFAPVAARFVRFTVTATNTRTEPCIDELEIDTSEETPRNVALASAGARATASSTYPDAAIHRLEHVNDGRYGNGRSWISNEPGAGWVQIALPATETIDRIVWGRDREEQYKDRLATEYRVEMATAPGAWRLVASSADRRTGPDAPADGSSERADLLRRQAELRGRLESLSAVRKVYAGTFAPPGPTHRLTRGDPTRPAEPVPPAAPAAVRPPLVLAADTPEHERRIALARWIGHPDNPLPARVMVNRAWHYHFGRGIVATPSDFGFNGARPSHPELLDWLAAESLGHGGRLKPIHRLILLSATYRQSSRPDENGLALDRPGERLWRMPPRRLEAEAIRDAILAVSGTLDLHMGGPGYTLWEPNTNYVVVFKPRGDLGPDTFRRMVYQFKPRSQPDPTFGAFDCPDAALVAPRRTTSTTALQALNLLNSRFLLAQSRCFAERLKRDAGDDPAAQAARAFRLAFGREPTGKELAAAVALIREHGAPAFCRALYNASEFLYIH